MSARRWEPPDDNGFSELREFGMRARVRRSSVFREGWLWVVDRTVRGRGLSEVGNGIAPRRRDAKLIAEAVIDAMALITIDEGLRRGRRNP